MCIGQDGQGIKASKSMANSLKQKQTKNTPSMLN